MHWLAARATDALGRANTSAVAAVTSSNATPPPAAGRCSASTRRPERRRARHGDDPAARHLAEPATCSSRSSPPTARPAAQTTVVSGGGLTWSLVSRANAQPGTSEIWKATAPAGRPASTVTSTPARPGYDQSLTVVAFANAGGVGAVGGAGAASGRAERRSPRRRDGSWVFGVGNDWDRRVPRTLGADQMIRHQWVDTGAGDTFWTQSQPRPTPAAGTAVQLDDTAPTSGRWNLAAVEVLAGSQHPAAARQDAAAGQRHRSGGRRRRSAGIVPLGATASDNVGVTRVQFNVDGARSGRRSPRRRS